MFYIPNILPDETDGPYEITLQTTEKTGFDLLVGQSLAKVLSAVRRLWMIGKPPFKRFLIY